jgi:transcriptional regulator with XRE-family HTH domain
LRAGQAVAEEDLAVGRRLARARHEIGLSQTDVGRRLGVAQSRIAKLEIGTRRLLFSEAVALATLYAVELGAFADNAPVERMPSKPRSSAEATPKQRGQSRE